jgi:tetratricopeptide (TPR) repeat protein
MDLGQIAQFNADASSLMKQGIALLDERRPAAAFEALELFNRALQLRLDLPVDPALGGDHFQSYLLAACWLNRGDALMQLVEADKIPAAINSYDEGIAAMSNVPLDDDPRYPRRLAMGLQNRGLALLAHGGRVDEALDSFEQSLDMLESDAASPLADRDYLLAGVWANIAIARAEAKTAEADVLARIAALRAIGLVGGFERDDFPSAEVGLKARYVLCQVIAGQLPAAGNGAGTMPEDVHEATDQAEAGLALAKRWEAKGELRFWPLAHDLYRFAEAVYGRYQPQFLAEFQREHATYRRT